MSYDLTLCGFCGKSLPVLRVIENYTNIYGECPCSFESRMENWRKSVDRRNALLEMGRPALGSPLRKEWLAVRRGWKASAKKRNRCKCGKRAWDKWTRTCCEHFLGHLKSMDALQRDIPRILKEAQS